jgi:hydroxymethylglutaryl-CoA lyase
MMAIIIHEVGLRDGLQAEEQIVPTEEKITWAETLLDSGVQILQLGSFVHPGKVPQMADTERLFRHFLQVRESGNETILSGLVLNERGLERGMACGVPMFSMGVSASDAHSRKNTGMGTTEAMARIIPMARRALQAGKIVQVSVQSAFGCGYEGPIPEERVLGIVKSYLQAGLTRISLADTAGHAQPAQVETLFGKIRDLDPGLECTCHFHNTYGLAIANCYAAFRAGVRCFESAFGGLGGCPFTAIAAGNVCTEDLVHTFQRMGLLPGISLEKITKITDEASRLLGRELPGFIHRTGPVPSFPGSVLLNK